MKSTLFVHAGGPKTGSSALQSFLEFNSEKLGACGVGYLNKAGISFEHQISSGNGEMLRGAICACEEDTASVAQVIKSYFENNSTAICSSELFSDFSPENWRLLANVCRAEGIELHVVFYVRNVIPFMKSVYDQLVKRHGMYEDFDVWVRTAEWLHIHTLRSLAETLSRDEITVISYEAINKRVVDSFVGLISIDALEHQDLIVNRSLTAVERDFLRRINREFGGVFSEEISDRMIYADPYARSEAVQVSAEIECELERRYGADLNWINKEFFGGIEVVSISGEGKKADRQPNVVQAPEEAGGRMVDHKARVQELVLDWALEKIALTQQSGAVSVANALLNIDWHLASDPTIPDDFDPIAYLLNNVDLITAGISPYAHFIAHGQYEVGRIWTAGPNAGWARAKEEFREKTRELRQLKEALTIERIELDADCATAKLSTRSEVESLLRRQAEREREYVEELAETYKRIDRERVASIDVAEKKFASLIEEHTRKSGALEKRLTDMQGQLESSRREIELLLRHQLERSHAHAEQLTQLRFSMDGERAASDDAATNRQPTATNALAMRASLLEDELSTLRNQLEVSRGEIESLRRRTAELERQTSAN
ncbi:hypothetical protein ACMAVI_000687 [Burkholderia cenocepacia]|uniref:hypothetical protein n=1 Tax=Burkholderia orbicola TaxID=2978683 RepID=UPI00264D8640|nr:hypothetical protein [Burkholderia orbicola]MDN7561446.1 hypothetical protein [Burkholderia orbicola]